MHPLDNPIWNSLTSRHAHSALGGNGARRYPPVVAPFAAVRDPSCEADLLDLVAIGERACILNVIPPISSAWKVANQLEIVQMTTEERSPLPDGETVQLTAEDHPAMLELTALVYPAYFRAETAALGDYFGVKDAGRLCAMAGVRMAMDGFQEISAVCVHPDFRGQGLARRLIARLTRHIQDQGDTVVLHTEEENVVARRLYESLGFKTRTVLPFWVLDRIS